jgi:hypothetical protein
MVADSMQVNIANLDILQKRVLGFYVFFRGNQNMDKQPQFAAIEPRIVHNLFFGFFTANHPKPLKAGTQKMLSLVCKTCYITKWQYIAMLMGIGYPFI